MFGSQGRKKPVKLDVSIRNNEGFHYWKKTYGYTSEDPEGITTEHFAVIGAKHIVAEFSKRKTYLKCL